MTSEAGGSGLWRRRLDALPAVVLEDGLTVQIAAGPFARLRGLAALEDLPGEHGLLLPRTRSVHTFGMRFPIDVVFVDRDLRVLRVVRDLRPRRIATCRNAAAAIEMRAGEADRLRAGLSLRRARANGS